MTTWIVDDGPLGDLAGLFDASWSWPAATLHVVETVARGAAKDKSGRRGKLLSMKDGRGAGCIVTHSVGVDTPAGRMIYGHLRKNASTSDEHLGEHESIAYCAHEDRTATFVAADKLACFLALAELGPARVASPFDLWWELKAQGLIADGVLDRLASKTAKSSGLPGRPLRFP